MRDLRIPLHSYFTHNLNKIVTRENYIDLCAIAAQSHLIFWYDVKDKYLDNLMGMEFAHMHCVVHKIPTFSSYARLIKDVMRRYNKETFQEKANLVAIFDTLTDAINEFEVVRLRYGLPEFP